MADETATVDPELKDIGDKIAGLTLKQAKELSDYISDEYGIEQYRVPVWAVIVYRVRLRL